MLTILAFDPSTKRTGAAVIRDGQVLHTGALVPVIGGKTADLDNIRADRLRQLQDMADALIFAWEPSIVAIETSEKWQRDKADGYKAVEALAQVRGVLMVAAHWSGVRVILMDAQRARYLVCGHARVPKTDVPHYLRQRGHTVPMCCYPHKPPEDDLDIADAVCLGLGVYHEQVLLQAGQEVKSGR